MKRTAVILLALAAAMFAPRADAAAPGTVNTSARSKWNAKRPLRKKTEFIILHTTEGSKKGSLEKLSANGECNYMIDEAGIIYVIIDKGRVAKHAGLSMWNGVTDLDTRSVGIEIVGYHDKDITEAQYTALKKLIAELKAKYKVPDEKVLTHSMVAYGAPNTWQKRKHRGRKRCAMLFALPPVRAKLGLSKKPTYDPDVRAGRLKDADPELSAMLYKRTTSALLKAGKPTAAKPAAATPPPKPAAAATPPKPAPSTPAKAAPAKAAPAPSSPIASTTFYFEPGKTYVTGSTLTLAQANALAKKAKTLSGYKIAGTVKAGKPVFSLVGNAWNKPDTYYWTKTGGLVSGDKITDRTIPKNAVVFIKAK